MDFPLALSDDDAEEENDDEDEDEEAEDTSLRLASTGVRGGGAASCDEEGAEHSDTCASDNAEEEDEEEDEEEQSSSRVAAPRRRKNKLFSSDENGKKSNRISGWFRKHIGGSEARHQEPAAAHAGSVGASAESQDVPESDSSDYLPTDYEAEAGGDLRYCPACLELNDCRREGKRRVLYFMPLHESAAPLSNNAGSAAPSRPTSTDAKDDLLQIDATCPRLRAYSEVAKLFPLSAIPRMYKNKRLAPNEKRRRQIVETYRTLVKQSNPAVLAKVNHFLGQVSEADRAFLCGNLAVVHKSSKSTKHQQQLQPQQSAEDSWEGCVALATSRRHWTEQYVVLTKADLSFFRNAESKKPTLKIPLSAIGCVQPVRPEEAPMAGFSFLQIETFARVYVVMVRSDMQLNEWVQAFITLLGGNVMRSPFEQNRAAATATATVDASGPTVMDADEDLYVAKSACWKLDKRRIFNYRRIVFNPQNLPERWRHFHPNALIESIAVTASSISLSLNQQQQPSAKLWVKFLDEISLLQTVNVSVLSERERIVFFLNLYHVMVMHGHMAMGPPPSWNYWNAFFNNFTYLVGYEVMSTADVDHNLLRAAMARPSGLSVIPVPNTQFPGIAITQRDFRFNYCINNSSRSLPGVVPVYTVKLLDKQLDEVRALQLFNIIVLW